jgi:acetate kinase
MLEPILVVNAGSSSIKFSVFETASDRSLRAGLHGQAEGIDFSPRLRISDARGKPLADEPVSGTGHDGAIAAIHEWFAAHVGSEAQFDGVGHRIVHGGLQFAKPIFINEHVLSALTELVPLATLHMPHQIAAVRAVGAAAPSVPQTACFDTAFHISQPPIAQQFALPRELTAKGIRRYGFHGLSYEYIVSALPEFARNTGEGRIIVAHLGNGASMCAIKAGQSIATTMSFTAVDGLPMGTRSGALDPAVILYLMRHEGMDAPSIERLIYERSGLLGVSGLSSDMRTLLASDSPQAKEAIDLFVYRIGRELGSLVAALGGLDGLIFTGGIGEHAHQVRSRVCHDAGWIGVKMDAAANRENGALISSADSAVPVWVIPTDENLMVARHTRHLLDQRSRATGH